jgi:hypothetical protein
MQMKKLQKLSGSSIAVGQFLNIYYQDGTMAYPVEVINILPTERQGLYILTCRNRIQSKDEPRTIGIAFRLEG